MTKSLVVRGLNLERENQLRDFDGIIGHITILMSRSIFLAFEQRCHDDPVPLARSFTLAVKNGKT